MKPSELPEGLLKKVLKEGVDCMPLMREPGRKTVSKVFCAFMRSLEAKLTIIS